MPDVFRKEVRSRIMSRIRSRDTKPEMALRKELWKRGLRYRIQYGKERVDIAFPKEKVAVFVDGCFWHSCPTHGHLPKSNRLFWERKLGSNLERSKGKDLRLRAGGWTVLHIWEHSFKAGAAEPAKTVTDALASKRAL